LNKRLLLTILGLAFTVHPLHPAEQNDVPTECAGAGFTKTGRPVMFPPRDGLSMGISTPELTLHADDPILIYVWVNNRTADEKTLLSCSMWWDWNVEVYDSQSHVVALRREPSPKPGYTVERVKLCGRNVLLRIPPRSCGPLQDMGDVAIDLRRDRDLPAGQYFVTEPNRPLPQPGLSISVVESPRATHKQVP